MAFLVILPNINGELMPIFHKQLKKKKEKAEEGTLPQSKQ